MPAHTPPHLPHPHTRTPHPPHAPPPHTTTHTRPTPTPPPPCTGTGIWRRRRVAGICCTGGAGFRLSTPAHAPQPGLLPALDLSSSWATSHPVLVTHCIGPPSCDLTSQTIYIPYCTHGGTPALTATLSSCSPAWTSLDKHSSYSSHSVSIHFSHLPSASHSLPWRDFIPRRRTWAAPHELKKREEKKPGKRGRRRAGIYGQATKHLASSWRLRYSH